MKQKTRALHQEQNTLFNFQDFKKHRYRFLYFVFVFVLVAFLLTAIIPILWLFITSFKTVDEINSTTYHLFPAEFHLSKVIEVWNKAHFGRYFLNSIFVGVGASVCAVFFNGLMAYAVNIIKPKGYKVVHILIMIAYMIPAVTGIIPIFTWLSAIGFTEGYLPYLALMLIFGANAFYYVNFKNYFESIPKSLFEAAKMDGCSDFKIFFKVVLPLSKPIIGVVSIFALTASWSDFLLPYLLLQDQELYTIMVEIFQIQTTIGNGFTNDEFLMLLVLSIIPQLIMFFLFQKQITNSTATSGIKE